jgi:arsenite-transporting ATPase
MTMAEPSRLGLLDRPTRHIFFTGKGGVGKTSIACAVSLALADAGKAVLLVSTDPASNLDEMLLTPLTDHPSPVSGVPRLSAMNIDPGKAADAYRNRVIAQMQDRATERERADVREQLSGACTTEIAAFDEFVGLLAGDETGYDHIVFDTAPTGHTLRLLSLPKAWTGFLADNNRGASCLGPHSGLKMREERFKSGLAALSDPLQTTIVLVTRPEKSAIAEAARTSTELRTLGLENQRLVVNGVFQASVANDPIAESLERTGRQALSEMPEPLRLLPHDAVPLRSFDMVGLLALRALLDTSPPGIDPDLPRHAGPPAPAMPHGVAGLDRLVDDLATQRQGLIMVMGKGGVGKTTVAAAVAVGLVQRGHEVHLSTTDPAAHVSMTLAGGLPGLRVDRIDPKAETARYIEKIMASRGRDLDEQGRALLLEDLKSPCTEEVAVFHAFSRIVAEARSAFVVLDTAPTGHTLMLMDATGAYHRQMTRNLPARPASGRIVTSLMRLQDPAYTHVVIVTLPETTPVSEAAALQEDLRRARIEPYAWVINRSLIAAGTSDPLLRKRLAGELAQIERVQDGLSSNVFVVPWQVSAPIGVAALSRLAA